MYELIRIIEEISIGIMENDYDKLTGLSDKLSTSLLTVFPLIIVTYSKEEMKSVSKEALEWPILLERIFTALQSDDRFVIVDVLYYVARKELLEFISLTEKMGISIEF